MPTYEYECTACGQHIEVFQRISEDPLTVCGACGGALRKVFHPAGIVFKGSGFYATDSRSKSKSGAGDKGEKTAKRAEESAGSKAEAGSSSSSPSSSSSSSSSEGGSASKEPGGSKAKDPA